MIGIKTEAFLCYTHADDEADSGQIRHLADQLRKQFTVITGEELHLFMDRDNLAWGDDWIAQIDNAIVRSRFFIPILTPSFFASTECRREFLRFVNEARKVDVETHLVLPVYWVTVPGFEDPVASQDEAIKLVASIQYENLRPIRLVEPTSAAFREAASNLAGALSRRVADTSPLVMIEPDSIAVANDDSDQAGFLEEVADADDAISTLPPILEAMSEAIVKVGEVMDAGSKQISDTEEHNIRARLVIAEKIALSLIDPAKNIEKVGVAFGEAITRIAPGMNYLIAQATLTNEPQSREFLRTIIDLWTSSKAGIGEIEGMYEATEGIGSMTRSMRKPMTMMRTGLLSVMDARELLGDWGTRSAEALASLDENDAAS